MVLTKLFECEWAGPAASNGLKDALQQRQAQPQAAQRLPIAEQSAAATLAANGSGVLAKRKVQELVEQVSPGETIDTEVEEVYFIPVYGLLVDDLA